MCEINSIPAITDPMGRYWKQPDRSELEFRDGAAFMSAEAFDALYDYTYSHPSGLYAGKMWKSFHYGVNIWFLQYVDDDPHEKSTVIIYSRAIAVTDEHNEHAAVDDKLPVWML